MAKIVVDVMLKPEILDPQGVAVSAALATSANWAGVGSPSTSISKRFPWRTLFAKVNPKRGKAAETLLANPVIETFTVRVEK